MKKITLFPIIALAIGILVSCNSAPDMETMKAKQAATVDSLVNAGISAKRIDLLAKCEETVQMAIKTRVDSLTAAATMVGKGTGKTVKKPTPAPPKPTPPKPAPAPAPTKPKTQIEEQKGRGGAVEVGKNVEEQKKRGGVIDPTKREDNINQQKKRGGAVPVPPQ